MDFPFGLSSLAPFVLVLSNRQQDVREERRGVDKPIHHNITNELKGAEKEKTKAEKERCKNETGDEGPKS